MKKLLYACLLGTVVARCHNNDPGTTKVLYMPDMVSSPTATPQKDYVDPPLGSVAVNAILYPKTVEEAERVLENPLLRNPAREKFRQEGEYLYQQVCVTCHGPGAKGDGTIVDRFPPPPDLTSELYRSKADGFYFYRITFGSALMPAMGDKLDPLERWKIIEYVRFLQEQAKL